MDNQQLKNIIKEIQQKEGVGLAEIAGQTGLDRSYLSSFIHAKVKKSVTEKMLGKLAKGYPIYFNGKQQQTTLLTVQEPTPDLPADTKALYERWLADKEKTQQQFHATNLGLIDLLKNKLDEIASNLMTGQLQLKEQLFAVNENLDQQLEGISRGLAAKDKKVVKKGTSVSARQKDGDGKGKSH